MRENIGLHRFKKICIDLDRYLSKMTKKEARKWIKAFKESKFKCIVPDQVLVAMEALNKGMRVCKRGAVAQRKSSTLSK